MWDANRYRLNVTNPNRSISDEELRKHNTVSDGWMVLKGKVFDVTAFIDFHPGGVANMKKGLGIDATALFNKAHGYVTFENILGTRKVGNYAGSHQGQGQAHSSQGHSSSDKHHH